MQVLKQSVSTIYYNISFPKVGDFQMCAGYKCEQSVFNLGSLTAWLEYYIAEL